MLRKKINKTIVNGIITNIENYNYYQKYGMDELKKETSFFSNNAFSEIKMCMDIISGENQEKAKPDEQNDNIYYFDFENNTSNKYIELAIGRLIALPAHLMVYAIEYLITKIPIKIIEKIGEKTVLDYLVEKIAFTEKEKEEFKETINLNVETRHKMYEEKKDKTLLDARDEMKNLFFEDENNDKIDEIDPKEFTDETGTYYTYEQILEEMQKYKKSPFKHEEKSNIIKFPGGSRK